MPQVSGKNKDRISQISGKVIVKETGVGIPDLMVVLFDADVIDQQAPKNGSLGQVLSDPLIPGFEELLFRRNFERLGSILTDEQGKFKLEYSSEDFANQDPEGKSELVIAVLAPEEPVGDLVPVAPYAGLPEGFITLPNIPILTQRVLYYSFFARINSGRNEAAIVRLTKKVLQDHAILYPGMPSNQSQSVDIAAEQAKADAARKVLDDFKKARVKVRLDQEKEVNRVADLVLTNFSLVDSRLAQHPQFLAKPEGLKAKLDGHISNGLVQLSAAPTVFFPVGALATTLIGWAALSTFLTLKGGSALERGPSLLEECKRKLQSREITNPTATPEDPNTAHTSGSSTETATTGGTEIAHATDNTTEGQVKRLTDTTTAPELQVRYDMVKGANLDATVQGLSLSAGPADQPSYHDFHSLRIAFKDIWTQVSDSRLGALTRAAVMKISNELGSDVMTNRSITTVQDLERVYEG